MLLGLFARTQTCWRTVRERLKVEAGAVATEYALLLMLIALAIIVAAGAFGTALAGRYTTACNSFGGTSSC